MNAEPRPASSSPQLTDDEIQKFCDFFYRKTGISFSSAKRYFIEKRILKRMDVTGHASFRTYFTSVRFAASADELQELINSMTVNETYFFREEHQFDALTGAILNEIAGNRKTRDPINIWSIPCSTGEEPYSIAIKLLEEWPMIDDVDVRIMASDIDTKVLEAAERGVYNERSISRLPKAYRDKYFASAGAHSYQLSNDLIECVERAVFNVSDRQAFAGLPKVDVIFCRNMLIYFDDVIRRQVISSFYDQLNPGGFLLLGHSESISRSSAVFRVRRFDDCIAYQKSL